MTKVECARPECTVLFTKATHNQRYCSSECCRLVTNAKIMLRYYENKAKQNSIGRICQSADCDSILSRYNTDVYCSRCSAKRAAVVLNKIKDQMRRVVV